MKKKSFSLVLSLCLCIAAGAQDKVVKNIIDMGHSDNRTTEHVDYLSNRIGGRLVGTHSLQDAEQWVKSQFESWGLEVTVQEVGEINVGFSRGPAYGRMLSEDGCVLHFGTPAYTAGTHGAQKGHVLIEPKNRQQFEKMKGRLKGAWVLVTGKSSGFPIANSQEANEKRAAIIAENEEIVKQNAEITAYNKEHKDSPKELLELKDYPALFYNEMVEAGVLGFIQGAKNPITILYDRPNCFNLTMDNLPTVCDIKLEQAQYDLIYKKASERQDFLLEFDIRNHFFKGPVKYNNIIATIKGSKYPDEYVIMGGHLDAYDGGTGAVDDGNGTAVMMEAARMLAMSGAKPKRSLMFCIWTGEEYGLLGSKFFVNSKMVDLNKISNYINRDSGPLMGTSVTVTPAMYDDFVSVCKPIENYNPQIPFKVNKREGEPGPKPTRGGSDHYYFLVNDVPTIGLTESDPLGYNFEYGEIWHTERDTFNKIIPEYLEHSAVMTAVISYGLANLDHLLSREGMYKKEN